MDMNFICRQKGFSLIEIMIAILVLSLVVTAFAALFTHSYQDIYSAGFKSEAQFVAQEVMESLIADIDFNHPDANVSTTTSLSIDFPGYGGSVAVQGKIVTVTVEYTDGQGNLRTQTFKSFIPD
jgi:type IV pilus modification protein PilV